MATNETIDKLKIAGYITVTADSQGIADQCQIGGGSSELDEYLEENNIQYEIRDNTLYGVYQDSDLHVVTMEDEEGLDGVYFYFNIGIKMPFYKSLLNFHKDYEFIYEKDKKLYKFKVKSDLEQAWQPEYDYPYVGISNFDTTVTPID